MPMTGPLIGGVISDNRLDHIFSSGLMQNPPFYFELEVPKHSMGLCIDVASRRGYLFEPKYGLYGGDIAEIDKILVYLKTEYDDLRS